VAVVQHGHWRQLKCETKLPADGLRWRAGQELEMQNPALWLSGFDYGAAESIVVQGSPPLKETGCCSTEFVIVSVGLR
jgi:hypothetical protein